MLQQEKHEHEITVRDSEGGIQKCWCGDYFKPEPFGELAFESEFDKYQKKKRRRK